MSDKLKELAAAIQKIVPDDISEWPTHAQAQHLQMEMLRIELSQLSANAAIAKTAAKAQATALTDLTKRVTFLENVCKWALGFATTIGAGLGLGWLASGGKHL